MCITTVLIPLVIVKTPPRNTIFEMGFVLCLFFHKTYP